MNVAYEEYRKNKIETALIYQDFVTDLLHRTVGIAVNQYSSRLYQQCVGESRSGIEIKHDEKFGKTGNLWIETKEKARPRSGDFVAAGIYRTDNTWLYVIGDYDTVFVFAKNTLRRLAESGRYRFQENGTHTSVGFLLPGRVAHICASTVLTPNGEQIIAKAVGDLQAFGRALHQALLGNPAQRSLFDDDPEDN